jgi:hypothetical protein
MECLLTICFQLRRISPIGGLDAMVLTLFGLIISHLGGISPIGGLDEMVLTSFSPIISYCGGISLIGGLDTVVLPAGHSTQGDFHLLLTFPDAEESSRTLAVSTHGYFLLHGILRPSNLTLGDLAIY